MKYPDNDIIGLFGGTGTALGYDEAGRLSTIPGILSSVTYNAVGAPMVQTNANGTTTTKTYDPDRFWLTDIDTTAPGSVTLQNLHYTLNAAGMATAVDSDVANEDWTYAYDELNRLTSAQNGVGANDQTWAYDSLGRFTSNSRVGSSFTYPSVGNARPHAPTQISGGPLGTLNFTYDANGNMTSGNGRTMTWDANNMITQVVANSNTTTFTYGPDATRIKKAAGATVAKYPFGDDYEIDGSGTVTKYFNAGFGVIAKKVGSTLYWLHTDRMGSINATTDGGGAQVLRRSYRSYGELLGQTGTHTESLGYIGQRTDEETANGTTDDKGLTYLHARYYDAALGIFLSPDPAGADRNTYRYSFGDSVNFADPTGLCGRDPQTGQQTPCIFPVINDPVCSPVPQPGCDNYEVFLLRKNPFGGGFTSEGFEDTFFQKRSDQRMYMDDIKRDLREKFGTGNDVNPPCGGKPCGPVGGGPDGPGGVGGTAGNGGTDAGKGKKEEEQAEKKEDPYNARPEPKPCIAPGYLDIGAGYNNARGLGATAGLILSDARGTGAGVFAYGGFSVGSPGASGNYHSSLNAPSPGLNVAFTISVPTFLGPNASGQVGIGPIGRNPTPFLEFGLGATPSWSLSAVWVSQPLNQTKGGLCQP